MKNLSKIINRLTSLTPVRRLFIVFFISLLILTGFHYPREKMPVAGYQRMVNAALRMQDALQAIRQFRMERHIGMDPILDPNQTGWIGAEFTPITTTLGSPESKQTALNPDFAGLITLWMIKLNVQKGDTIALQMSGSFPALNIASIIACEELQAHPIISSSAGASSYGANLPEFTYLDMEKWLLDQGIIHHCSSLVTFGGDQDNGSSLWEGGGLIIRRAAERNGYSIFVPISYEDALTRKWDFFRKGNHIKAFINVGGNHTSLGNCSHSTTFPTGLVKSVQPCFHSQRGLLMVFAEKNIPIIHLLNIRSLAVRNGMPVAPSPFPAVGTANFYVHEKKSRSVAIALTTLLLACWGLLYNPQSIPFSLRTISTKLRW
jgi:poly-gamma-glutamate system protein